MKAMLVNRQTGEVVECRTDFHKSGVHCFNPSLVAKRLRGVIRQWMKQGLNIHDFDIIDWSSFKVYEHLRQYAWNKSQHDCDICHKTITCEETVWMDDSEGVCLVAGCHDCMKGGN